MIEFYEIKAEDFDVVWPILEPAFRSGETYPTPTDISFEEARTYWFAPDKRVFLARQNSVPAGTYYIKPNQIGLGAHICNAGFVVAESMTGRGLGTALGRDAIERARSLGYRGMQFNLVVANNAASLRIWDKLGFDIIGTVPGAFQHSRTGLTDAYILFKQL